MIHTWALWGQDVQRDIWVCLQEPEAVLTNKALDTPSHQEDDALGKNLEKEKKC